MKVISARILFSLQDEMRIPLHMWPSRTLLIRQEMRFSKIKIGCLKWGVQSWTVKIPSYMSIHVCCSVIKSCLTHCDLMDCRTSGFRALHYLLEMAQTHVHCVGDAIQPSHLLLPSSLPALSLPQHQSFF